MSRNVIDQHPDEVREDLNPDYHAGENYGPGNCQLRYAIDLKEFQQRFPEFRSDQLKQIPILEEGSRLEQGAVYFDVLHPERGAVKATGNMVAGNNNWFVPKSHIDYELWNLLTGSGDPDRMPDLVSRDTPQTEPTN